MPLYLELSVINNCCAPGICNHHDTSTGHVLHVMWHRQLNTIMIWETLFSTITVMHIPASIIPYPSPGSKAWSLVEICLTKFQIVSWQNNFQVCGGGEATVSSFLLRLLSTVTQDTAQNYWCDQMTELWLNWQFQCTVQTPQCTLYTVHCTQYIVHCTPCATEYTLHFLL